MNDISIEDQIEEEEIISEEKDKKQKKQYGKVARKTIKKAKWKYVIQLPMKQYNVFYIYGSFVIFTDFSPENVISTHQQTQCVALNKMLNTIETKYNIVKPGLTDFSFLVKLFESKQDQQYYEFAQSLKDFKIFVDTLNKTISEQKKILKGLPKILDKLDEQYPIFEKWCDQTIEKHFKDEFFSYSIFQLNYRRGFAEVKKNSNSQNLITLYGNSLDEILESEMCKMKNKQFSMERNQDFDGPAFLQTMTHTLKCSAFQIPFSSRPFSFRTLEGFQIPAVNENYFIKFSDHKKDDKDFIFFSDVDYIMFVSVIKIEDCWLKRLLDVRQDLADYKKPNNPRYIPPMSQNIPQECSLMNSINSINDIQSSNSMINENSQSMQSIGSSHSMQTEPKYSYQEETNNNITSEQTIQQNDGQQKCSEDQIETELCFIPQMIDLVGSDCMETIIKNEENQNEKKQKVADCLEKYYTFRQQAIELSTLEYQCQVEYFIDRFYKKSDEEQDQKQCQFRSI